MKAAMTSGKPCNQGLSKALATRTENRSEVGGGPQGKGRMLQRVKRRLRHGSSHQARGEHSED